MEQALFQLIGQIPGLMIAASNIFVSMASKDAIDPYVIMQRIESVRIRDLTGPSGLMQVTVQIDSYAQKYYDAKKLALQIEKALDGYSGSITITGSSPQDICKISSISCQNDVDLFDITDEPFLHRVSADYLITYDQP
jgi:hypothetical protein